MWGSQMCEEHLPSLYRTQVGPAYTVHSLYRLRLMVSVLLNQTRTTGPSVASMQVFVLVQFTRSRVKLWIEKICLCKLNDIFHVWASWPPVKGSSCLYMAGGKTVNRWPGYKYTMYSMVLLMRSHNIHCTMHTVYLTLDTSNCTLNNINCTL